MKEVHGVLQNLPETAALEVFVPGPSVPSYKRTVPQAIQEEVYIDGQRVVFYGV